MSYEIKVDEEALLENGAPPDLARAIANLGTISLSDSLRLVRLQVHVDFLEARVKKLENKNHSS